MLTPTHDDELITEITDLTLPFSIGVLPEEKRRAQPVRVSVWMASRPAGPHVSEALADYVSYAEVVDRIRAIAASGRHIELVETLAEQVAAAALVDPRVSRVVVAVRKPEIIAEAESVGVVIQRTRPA